MGEKFEAFTLAILMLIVLGVLMAWPVQILWNGCLIHAYNNIDLPVFVVLAFISYRYNLELYL